VFHYTKQLPLIPITGISTTGLNDIVNFQLGFAVWRMRVVPILYCLCIHALYSLRSRCHKLVAWKHFIDFWLWFSGEICVACPAMAYPYARWRSVGRCMLGSILSFWWTHFQKSWNNWRGHLPKVGGTFVVSIISKAMRVEMAKLYIYIEFIWSWREFILITYKILY